MMATPMTKSMIQYAFMRAPALKDASPLRGRRLRCSLPALSSNVFLSRCSAMQLLYTKGVPSPSVCKWLCDDTSRKLLSQGPDLPKEPQKIDEVCTEHTWTAISDSQNLRRLRLCGGGSPERGLRRRRSHEGGGSVEERHAACQGKGQGIVQGLKLFECAWN